VTAAEALLVFGGGVLLAFHQCSGPLVTASAPPVEAVTKTRQWMWWVLLVLSRRKWGPLLKKEMGCSVCVWEIN